ncbi:MAG: site-specific DNA-methyltransferase [Acidobacteria bacterium]|nr:site-specific DNA-methyltransferase [Acidobacteriota bacterium]
MRAPRNRTLTCTEKEIQSLSVELLRLAKPISLLEVSDRIINQELEEVCSLLPKSFVDLLILDPPYNLTKDFNGHLFKEKESLEYSTWFEENLNLLLPLLKTNASVYVCSDWRTSTLIFPVLERYFHVRNRITWEREKGRGSLTNWKNNTEDIWYCTLNNSYTFNVDAVKLKRKVIAPYRAENGQPKDWDETSVGNYRLTHPSNLWSDITIPFWSMPENTDHPTQKPEKLIAKLVLASSKPGEFVLDPFLGSGTTAVVAKKLGRRFCGIERNKEYCCWAIKRLNKAQEDMTIQGYADGVFWERNSLNEQKLSTGSRTNGNNLELFDV